MSLTAGIIVLVINAAMLIGISIYANKQVKNSDDFLVAGRSMKWPVVSGSIMVTWAWGSTVLVAAEGAVTYGWPVVWMYALSGVSLPVAAFMFKKARKVMPKGTTLTEYAGVVFGPKAHKAIVFVTLFINIILLMYLGTGLGTGLGPIFGIGYNTIIIVCIIVIIIFTMLGGVMSSIMTDNIQYIIMWIVLGIIAIYALVHSGGVDGVYERIVNADWDSGRAVYENWSFLDYGLPVLVGWLTYGIADQTMWQRAYSVDEDRHVVKAFTFGWIAWSLVPALAALIGLIATVLGTEAEYGSDVVANLLVDIAPAWLMIGWAFLMFNAIASSLGSVLVSTSAIIINDIILAFRPEKQGDSEFIVKMNKILIVLLGIGTIILSVSGSSLLSIGIFLSGFLIVTGVPLYLSFIIKKINRASVLWAVIISFILEITLSTAVSFGWLTSIGGIPIYRWQIYVGIFILEVLIVVLGSLVKPGKEVDFEALQKNKDETAADGAN